MSVASDDGRKSGDSGTVLERIDGLLAESGERESSTLAEPRPATAQEPLPALRSSRVVHAPEGVHTGEAKGGEDVFRPIVRPSVPRLTILDDGELTVGEIVRLRERTTAIGRNTGAIRLPHDPQVSAMHAEVVREGSGPPYLWSLRDLGSSNGTFVCCSKTILCPDRLLILGSRRFRFRLPLLATTVASDASSPQHSSTLQMDTEDVATHLWPSLVESVNLGQSAEIVLRGPNLSVGRPGCGNDIELDDPLIAQHHAQITRDLSGEWRIESRSTKNGIWVQISAIQLTNICRFQCGEQRFLFVV
ncbi:MAG: FHA domain-containing protein [Planctomycetota bacterium]